ncbi:MAG TPA: LapA family protein [Candidatus Tectomicrobia bacterium]|jgi:uncharacterized integral membrane protein|nr:LapA family protein [Candidatus Tectomicrobia bacterium]
MAVIVFVLGAIVGMAVLLFALQNQEPVTLHFLSAWQTQPIPLFLVMIASVASGFVMASLFGLAAYLRQRRIIRQQRRTVADLQAELQALRTLPTEAPSGVGSAAGTDRPAPSADEFSAP